MAAAGSTEKLDGAARVYDVKPGTAPVIRVVKPDGRTVSFVVLTPEQGRHLWRLPFGGQDRAILSDATVLADGRDLHLQADDVRNLSLSLFPAVTVARSGAVELAGSRDGIFTHYAAPPSRPPAPIMVSVHQQRAAGTQAAGLKGTNESTWNDAATFALAIPPSAAHRHVILNINYIGDAARLYLDDKLLDDNFYNGDPFPIALWRTPPGDWANLRLKVLPYSDGLLGRLPEQVKATVSQAKGASTLDKITVTATEQQDWRLSPMPPRSSK